MLQKAASIQIEATIARTVAMNCLEDIALHRNKSGLTLYKAGKLDLLERASPYALVNSGAIAVGVPSMRAFSAAVGNVAALEELAMLDAAGLRPN